MTMFLQNVSIIQILQIILLFGNFLKREATIIDQSRVPLQSAENKISFTAAQKLRIFMEFTNSFNALTDAQFYKDNVVTPAVNYLQNALSPKNPSSTPILVNRDCETDFEYFNNDIAQRACTTDCAAVTKCGNMTIPDKYLKKCQKKSGSSFIYSGTDGVGASGTDIVILVNAISCSGSMLASALTCFQEPSLDRPVLGVLILCTQQYNPRYNIQMNINTIKHEIVHALGFASDNFAFFRDQSGVPLTIRNAIGIPNLGFNAVGGFHNFSDKVAKIVTRNRKSLKVTSYTKKVYTLTLPTLLSMARTYYNCPTLDGFDLEDSAPNTVNSHFDKLFVGNELMTANADVGEGLTSIFTLAILQDTGWYTADFTMAENLTYGKGLGCNFVLNGCYDYILQQTAKQSNISPFCNLIQTGYAMKCSDDRRYTYGCQIIKSVGLDPNYVYFNQLPNLPAGDNANDYAGSNNYNEFCPVNMKDSYGLSTSDCNVLTNSLRTDSDYVQWKDYYGSDSKCFDTTATAWNTNSPSAFYQPGYYGAKCLQYKCNPTTLTLYVYNNNQIVCQTTTQSIINQIKVNYLTASINCPTYADVCLISSTNSTTLASTISTISTFKSKANYIRQYIQWIIIPIIYYMFRV